MAKNILELIEQIGAMEKLLTSNPNDILKSHIKTINEKTEFKIWIFQLKESLLQLKQTGIIIETIDLINNGFKNGYTDERDFNDLKVKLIYIYENLSQYQINTTPSVSVNANKGKLSKSQSIDTTFDKYVLVEQIGEGGNGRVFSAKNSDGELFAIKFIDRSQSSIKLKRFKNEIHFCEHHQHKNIVPILDHGQVYLGDKEYVFYVMPLYAETLKDKMKFGIPHEHIVEIFIDLLKGLKFSHEHGSIHRDIKPENILFAENSLCPVICDFGIAHFSEEDLITAVETRASDRMANFNYAAPEQKKTGGNVCFQTDIYALALILNEMFTGEIPQAGDYKRIADINIKYKYLDDLFDKLFKQDPKDRLYPEDIILSEMRVLAEKHNNEQEAERLKSVTNELVLPEEFSPSIINMEFKNKAVHFVFDSMLHDAWFKTLVSGSYSRSWQMGYEPERMKKIDKNTIAMPVRGDERDQTIVDLVGHVKSWISEVNKEYSRAIKAQAIAEQRKKEEARLAEIKRIEKETTTTTNMNSLLKGLL